jgi:Domain of unknown function (DUF4416)
MRSSLPTPALPFCSFLYREDLHPKKEFLKTWEAWFKNSLKFYHPFFSMSEYYSKEMGPPHLLNRFFLIGLETFPREVILAGKLKANEEEEKFKFEGSRTVNIDFGVLSLENVILATYKPFAHRVYLTEGVYLDLTYTYQDKTYNKLPWTYPDYAHPEILNFFNRTRDLLLKKIREGKPSKNNCLGINPTETLD